MAQGVPSEVLSDHFQERLSGKRLLGALFLTFEFDAGFFEQQILPVILDTPVSHAEVARLLQLEDALRHVPHGVAVFYDWTGLRSSDHVAPRLDVQRLPVRQATGIFHPKNVLLLTEDLDADENSERQKRMLVGTLSANLTRSGWWENVEACHIEEIEEGSTTRFKDPLLSLLQRLDRLTASDAAGKVLAPYRAFVRTLEQGGFKSKDGWLSPHFYVGGVEDGESVVDFLRALIPRDTGFRMEVISPFFDKAPAASPLAKLQKAFQPEELRVYLPQDVTGKALCSEEMYQYVRDFGHDVSWGNMPEDLLALGRGSEANRRGVHAKVYRFFRPQPKEEYLFLGSANLTAPGHLGKGGNLETGVLVQVDPAARPDFWLRTTRRKPATFEAVTAEDELPVDAPLPVQLRYSWKTHEASGRWDGATPVPRLTLLGSGGPLANDVSWTARTWTALPADVTDRLASELKSTSIIAVRTNDARESRVLVQEEDMALKPELARRLPVRDILHYWALLKPEQRQAFLDSRAGRLTPGELGELMVRLDDDGGQATNDIFERAAGVFHAFAQLEARVMDAINAGYQGQAAALIFGQRFDSLGTVLDRVLLDEGAESAKQQLDDVDRYLVLLCARQLCDFVRDTASDFWGEYAAQAANLEASLARRTILRETLCAREPEQMPEFMNWFDKWFLRRAQVVTQ